MLGLLEFRRQELFFLGTPSFFENVVSAVACLSFKLQIWTHWYTAGLASSKLISLKF